MTAAAAANTSTFAYRELAAIGQIAHALLVADLPEEVHQFALDRVTPLLGASFSLVLLLDVAGETMHAVAQHEWPERYGDWIGSLRVRVGQGPSGLAVLEERVVEVSDLHADPALSDWFDVANELGFRSIVAAPLMGSRGAVGAVAFYFSNEQQFSVEQRDLVKLIADQLAATHDKADMIAQLRRANAALAEANSALEEQTRDQHDTQARQLLFFENFTRAMADGLTEPPLTAPSTTVASASGRPIRALQRLAMAAHDTVRIERGAMQVCVDDVDPREPLLQAVAEWRPRALPQPITVGEPTVLFPTMRTDARILGRALDLALGSALQQASEAGAGVHADVELGRGFVAYRLQWTVTDEALVPGAGTNFHALRSNDYFKQFDPFDALAEWAGRYGAGVECAPGREAHARAMSPLDLPLSRLLARLLGGDVQRISERTGELAIESLSLIFPLDAAPDTAAAMGRLPITHTH